MSDVLTAFLCGGSPNSQSPIAANMDGDERSRCSFCRDVERNRTGMDGERKGCIAPAWRKRPGQPYDTKSGAFHYIERAHPGEVVIGRRSIHMTNKRELFFATGVSRNAAP